MTESNFQISDDDPQLIDSDDDQLLDCVAQIMSLLLHIKNTTERAFDADGELQTEVFPSLPFLDYYLGAVVKAVQGAALSLLILSIGRAGGSWLNGLQPGETLDQFSERLGEGVVQGHHVSTEIVSKACDRVFPPEWLSANNARTRYVTDLLIEMSNDLKRQQAASQRVCSHHQVPVDWSQAFDA